MSFIINYMNKQLMIHFSDIVVDGKIQILNIDNEILKVFPIQNKEFVNLYFPLEDGIYHIKISEGRTENMKSIIVNCNRE